MKRWVVLDADGYCVNVVLWDGGDGWQPPDGCTAVDLDEHPDAASTVRPVPVDQDTDDTT